MPFTIEYERVFLKFGKCVISFREFLFEDIIFSKN